ncbi:uncharacterized protein LOC134227790 [Armigeres subalbatus]|uniref:uncharacterized protein LOC134227790 n=1 Tax=Armigeres subalbatus TaxID=124917 RepID=UPI002ED1EF00
MVVLVSDMESLQQQHQYHLSGSEVAGTRTGGASAPITTITTTTSTTSSTAAVLLIADLSSIRIDRDELSRSASSPLMSSRSKEIPGLDSQRSSHCPVVREGPALGCNFCWNTRRILRRKTKYHCPECQTNLCIAPCFQEYHERQSAENSAPTSNDSGSGCVYGVGGLYAKVDLRCVENLYFCGIVSFSLLFLMGNNRTHIQTIARKKHFLQRCLRLGSLP